MTGQLWSLSTTAIEARIKVQLNTILYAKTLVRKDIASTAALPENRDAHTDEDGKAKGEKSEFSSKAQIMTLMTTDVNRVGEFAWHFNTLLGALVNYPHFRNILNEPPRLANRNCYRYYLSLRPLR